MERTDLKIRLHLYLVKIYLLSHDADVLLDVVERRYRVSVPAFTLGEGYQYVPAQRLGRAGKRFIRVLP